MGVLWVTYDKLSLAKNLSVELGMPKKCDMRRACNVRARDGANEAE